MLSKRLFGLMLSLLSCLSMAFGPPVLTNSDLSQRSLNPSQVQAMRQVPPPEISAVSSILVNVTTGQILYAHNERERHAPASLVKIVTALVALERGRLDKEYRVTDDDIGVGTSAWLQVGELVSVHDLLYLLLIPSDNAAGMILARGIGKEVPTYVGWMNDLVKGWGLADTHFTNPHGLDAKNEYTSAYDMAIIGLYAMRNPTFADIVGHLEDDAAGRHVQTTNTLLNTYPGAVGVKTGTTDRAGENFVGMVSRPTGKALSVVLGSQDRFVDTRLLMDYYYANYAELHIDLGQNPQNRYLDENHAWREFGLREPFTLLVNPVQASQVTYFRRIDNISANPSPDTPIGVLQVSLAGKPFTEVPLYAR